MRVRLQPVQDNSRIKRFHSLYVTKKGTSLRPVPYVTEELGEITFGTGAGILLALL